jgi:hypothetical protein
MPEIRNETAHTKLRITREKAQHVADMLRYAVSLNTTAGLVSPTQRRLATTTYKAVEESSKTWTGSLEEDHRRALELMQKQRDSLRQAMSGRLPPEQSAEYLEVSQDQFLELVRPNTAKGAALNSHGVNALTREPGSTFAATAGRGRILLCATCT